MKHKLNNDTLDRMSEISDTLQEFDQETFDTINAIYPSVAGRISKALGEAQYLLSLNNKDLLEEENTI